MTNRYTIEVVILSQRGFDPELTTAIIGTLREPLVVLDQQLRVIVANRAFYTAFQMTYEQVRGATFYSLGNGEWEIPALHELLEKIIPEDTSIDDYEVEHVFTNLGQRTMLINAREIVFAKRRKNILLSISDVTAQRKNQRDRERLMMQKDTLLKEMRHRIANSLQLIASVILLKAGTVKSEESRMHLEDMHDRILSIATVQRNLEPTAEDTAVPVVAYLRILCESISKSMIAGRKPITITVLGSEGVVSSDDAIGLGLITTELVMNALKHAFPKQEGAITVTYESHGNGGWRLGIADDGIGIAAANTSHREGLGTNIVASLATQLNATVSRASSSVGTTISIVHADGETIPLGI